jgi:hypothetical protein
LIQNLLLVLARKPNPGVLPTADWQMSTLLLKQNARNEDVIFVKPAAETAALRIWGPET